MAANTFFYLILICRWKLGLWNGGLFATYLRIAQSLNRNNWLRYKKWVTADISVQKRSDVRSTRAWPAENIRLLSFSQWCKPFLVVLCKLLITVQCQNCDSFIMCLCSRLWFASIETTNLQWVQIIVLPIRQNSRTEQVMEGCGSQLASKLPCFLMVQYCSSYWSYNSFDMNLGSIMSSIVSNTFQCYGSKYVNSSPLIQRNENPAAVWGKICEVRWNWKYCFVSVESAQNILKALPNMPNHYNTYFLQYKKYFCG